MKRQHGLSLPELLFVLALLAVTALIATAASTTWLQRETARSSVHELVSAMQTTRVEAVSRNRPCRLVLDASTRSIDLWDGEGTATPDDDRRIRRTSLPSGVSFADPESGSPISLASLGENRWQTTFASDGSVVEGDGSVVLLGGGTYYRLSVLAAGGVLIETWNGTEWS